MTELNKQELDQLLQEYQEKAFTMNYLVQQHQAEVDALQRQIDVCVEKIQGIIQSDAATLSITSSFILANGIITRENWWQSGDQSEVAKQLV